MNKCRLYTCCHSRNRPGFCSSPSAKNCPFSCRVKRALPSGETLILPVSRDSRYNTLHFASKVVCQRGLRPPLETPTRKGGMLPLHGAHTAFSCYPALRLFRLIKSQRGIGVVGSVKYFSQIDLQTLE